MVQRFYPAVLERGAHDTFGVWFPDFPGCIAAARTQEDAMGKAQEALAIAVERMAEREEALPAPSPFEAIEIPAGCDLVTYFAVGVEPPDPSERVNVYLPKGLIARADRCAAEFGMSRSSLFGLALSTILRRDDANKVGAALIDARAMAARAQMRVRTGARKRA